MAVVYAGPVCVAVVCYINTLCGEFVHDDVVAVVRNRDVTGGTGLGQLVNNDFWGTALSDPSSHKSYRPLTALTFRYGSRTAYALIRVLSRRYRVSLHLYYYQSTSLRHSHELGGSRPVKDNFPITSNIKCTHNTQIFQVYVN